jgi:hypothetical protein
MPSVSMCTNDTCPLAVDCYRHEATPCYAQTYTNFKTDENGDCDYFMEIFKKKEGE